MNDLQLKYTLYILFGYGICNLISFFAFGIDKYQAKKHRWRISEKTLFLFSALFGALGGILGMYTFRHKTKKWYFVVFTSLLCLVQIGALYLILTRWLSHLL
ncbi:MAG: DUF1294 domain-containing protein [Oscillospiraceae bacterium]